MKKIIKIHRKSCSETFHRKTALKFGKNSRDYIRDKIPLYSSSRRWCFVKNVKFNRKTPASEILYINVTGLKNICKRLFLFAGKQEGWTFYKNRICDADIFQELSKIFKKLFQEDLKQPLDIMNYLKSYIRGKSTISIKT